MTEKCQGKICQKAPWAERIEEAINSCQVCKFSCTVNSSSGTSGRNRVSCSNGRVQPQVLIPQVETGFLAAMVAYSP